MRLSLKSKIQIWHGLILAIVLTVLGVGFYFYEKAHRMAEIDQHLDELIAVLMGTAMQLDEQKRPGRGREEKRPRPPRPHGGVNSDMDQVADGWKRRELSTEAKLNGRDGIREPGQGFRFFESELEPLGYYYYIVSRRSGESYQSSNFPELDIPDNFGSGWFSRLRDGRYREMFHAPPHHRLLVGQDLRPFYEGLNRLKLVIAASVALVWLGGFFVGWVLVSRSLRSLGQIEHAACRIAGGALDERIPEPSESEATELKSLTDHLNHTFGQLEYSFQRQIRFTADASHELRTPLTALLAQIELGLKRERSTQEYRHILEVCGRSGARIERITKQLIELSRYDSGQVQMDFETINLDTLLTSLAEELQPYVEQQKGYLKQDLSPVEITCDPFRLEQVITNIVNNALQHNAPGITITLRSKEEGEYGCIEIVDTGKGIEPENLNRLFDRFFQESRSRTKGEDVNKDNVGLGLSISQAIVRAHGGSIEITSRPFVETKFKIRIPRQVAPMK